MPNKKDVQDIIKHITWVHDKIQKQEKDELALAATLKSDNERKETPDYKNLQEAEHR